MTIFAFLDVETTGLEPENNYVLEVAWQLTNMHFEPLSRPKSAIVDQETTEDWTEVFRQIDASPFLTNMHTESGLLEELRNGPGVPRPMGEILDTFVRDAINVGATTDQVRLAGYSVSFDREFLKANGWWDLFEAKTLGFQMHHRILDLSSNIQLYQAAGRQVPSTYNSNPHRALDDALDALDLAQLMKEDLA